MAKRTYNVQAPDGSTLSFEGPDDATPDQIRAAAERAYAARGGQQQPVQAQPAVPVIEQRPQSRAERAVEGLVLGVTGGRVGAGSRAEAQDGQESPLFGGTMGGLITGHFQRVPTRQEVGAGVRYGVPAAAQLAASPLIAAGPAGVATMSGIGAAVGYPSSLLGQLIAGEEVSHREAAADAAMFAMPFSAQGRFLARAAFNVPAAIATVEAAEAIRQGEYVAPKSAAEAFKRWGVIGGLTGGASYFGARSQRVGEVQRRQAEIATERLGGGAMISELIPSATSLEKKVLAAGNGRARELMDKMGASFDEAVARGFPEAESNEPLRRYLGGQRDRVAAAKADLASAEQAATEARERAIQLSTGENLRAYDAARREAFDLALIAQGKKLAQEAAERFALGSNALTASDIGLARQVASINRTLDAGRNSLKEGIGAAYEAAGIGPNTPVVSLKSVLASISARSGRRGAFEDNTVRKETIDAIKGYFDKHGQGGVITRGDFQRLQSGISEQLVGKNMLPDNAQRIAGEAYDAVRSASDSFIKKNMPEQYAAWTRARALASKDFALRDTPAMELLRKGDASGFYNAISKEGNGQTMETVRTYADLLAQAGQPEAAQAFAGEINQFIARGVLAKASSGNLGTGRDALTQIVDPAVLWKELDSLRALKFPVEQLGLGTRDQIRAAARLSSVKASGGITTKDLNEFLELAGEVGTNKAVAKMDYYNAVRNEQIANRTRKMRLASYEARQAAKRANATQADQAAALARLEDDPIIRVLNDPNFKVPIEASNSAKFNASLLSMEPKTASTFVEALEGAGRGADLENLRKGMAYGVMNKRKTLPDGSEVLDSNAITDFFFKRGDPKLDIQRDVYKRVVGPDAYANMERNIARPLQRIGEVQRSLNYEPGLRMPTLVGRVRPPDESPVRATVVGTLRDLSSLINAGRYNTLYTLYVNPKTAPMWSAAMKTGGDLSKQPVLVTAIRLAEEQDRKEAESR